MEKEITKRIKQAIREKVFPGCVVGVMKKNGKKFISPFGKFTYEEDSKCVTKDTMYDIASVTKSIPTSCLLLTLIDNGKISLDDAVSKYLPEFGNEKNKNNVLIRHLLSYTVSLDVHSMSALKDKSADEIIHTVITAKLKDKPGSRFLYTNSTALLIGMVVDKVSGKSLDAFARDSFFKHLKMNNTTFHPNKYDINKIPPTEIDDWRGLVHGVVHDESTYTLQQKYYVGIAGIFSTVPDILNFLEMLLNYGMLKAKRYFKTNTVKQMMSNQLRGIKETAGLGWRLNEKWFMGKYCSKNTFGITGFTGCSVLCDPIKGLGIALFSNRTYPTRKTGIELINGVRSDIANIVLKNC